MQKRDFSRAIEEIKEAAKSIEKNAEKIVGGYKYQTDLYITIQLSPVEPVRVSVNQEYLPEGIFETDTAD